ncbi:MAG: glycosyltransferase family 4 protein [Vicinamibacterales bacterium]
MSRIPSEWVIVAGGFHDRGAMDRANAALAAHLLRQGARVHLVGHDIDDRFRRDAYAQCYDVPRPRSAAPIAESLLSRRGFSVALRVTTACPEARVVVNGGNCPWPDVNWVHAVHAAWPVCDEGAPAWVKVKHRAVKALARRQERAALRGARVVIANSRSTERTIVAAGLAGASAVHTVYLGSDSSWSRASAGERCSARASFNLTQHDRVVVFVGTLGFDLNKGFDLLWAAWERLVAAGDWNVRLLVAGAGGRLPFWRRAAERAGLGGHVHFLGHTSRVREVLAAADLLVSPVRYEAYGLNVQEALCRGTAVLVTGNAGIVERFDEELEGSVLPVDVSSDQLAETLRAWAGDVEGWRLRAASTAARLQSRSWDDMAGEIVAFAADSTVVPA